MTKQTDLTLKVVCQVLGKSKRTIARYIKKGLLNPEKVKNERGILEYRFERSEVEDLKNSNTIEQETGQKQKAEQKTDGILSVIKFLEKQLKVKDRQIKQLLDRQRETNILMGQLQNRVLLLENKNKGKKDRTGDRTEDKTNDKGWHIKNIIARWFKK